MVNTNATRQQEACTIYQVSSCSTRAMQKKKKRISMKIFNKKTLQNFLEKSQDH